MHTHTTASAPVGNRPLGTILSPLIVEPDGFCGPLQYAFPRRFGLGNILDAPLDELAEPWLRTVHPALLAVAAAVADELDTADAPTVVNCYQLLATAAANAEGR